MPNPHVRMRLTIFDWFPDDDPGTIGRRIGVPRSTIRDLRNGLAEPSGMVVAAILDAFPERCPRGILDVVTLTGKEVTSDGIQPGSENAQDEAPRVEPAFAG